MTVSDDTTRGSDDPTLGDGAQVDAVTDGAEPDTGLDVGPDAGAGLDDTGLDDTGLDDTGLDDAELARLTGTPGRGWHPDEYAPFVTGSGAHKLADSAVAPLVAAARPYSTADASNHQDIRTQIGVDGRKKQGGRFKDACLTGDAMVMPAYRFNEVIAAQEHGTPPTAAYYQFRPHEPSQYADPKTGKVKEMKYEVVSGQELAICAHPAAPASWVTGTAPLLLAEGLLKADSAFTALLLAHGVTRDDLALDDTITDVDAARAALAALCDRVPEDSRVAVLSMSSCNSWNNKSEWASVGLRGRDMWVGLDADVSSNLNVWREAKQLFDFLKARHATPHLLAPTGLVETVNGAATAKWGIDDYLSHIGDWPSLLTYLTPALPEQPTTDETALVGKWRVRDGGYVVSECVANTDLGGNPIPGVHWEPRIPIGGRIVSRTIRRGPSLKEDITGALDPHEPGITETATVEVQWRDPAGEPVHVEVTGPTEFLNERPEVWHSKIREKGNEQGKRFPFALSEHPDWPPTRQDGAKWLSAIKAANQTGVVSQVEWTTMGWVPVEGRGVPAFIAGSDIVCDPGDEDRVIPGITNDVLSGANEFGLDEIDPRPFDDPDYQADLRADIEAVLDVLVRQRPWTSKAMTLIVLATALRPVIPLPNTLVVYLSGAKASGKTWTASMIMSFWRSVAARGLTTTPGSVSDTKMATERAISMTPLWVMDDLPPAQNSNKANSDLDKVDEIIRTVYGGRGRRASNIHGGERAALPPRAGLIVTAENLHSNDSIRQRCINYQFRPGSLHPDKAVTNAMLDVAATGAPARVTQGFIKWMRYRSLGENRTLWAEWLKTFNYQWDGYTRWCADMVKERSRTDEAAKRAGDITAHIVLTIVYFQWLCEAVKVDRDLAGFFNYVESDALQDLFDLMAVEHRVMSSNKYGHQLVQAIVAAVSAGHAHITSTEPGVSWPTTNDNPDQTTGALGWTRTPSDPSKWQPRGLAIGKLVVRDGVGTVLLDPMNALNVAKNHYPSLVPAGTNRESVWNAVWDEKLAADLGKRRNKTSSKGVGITVQVRLTEGRISGVPIPLTYFTEGVPTIDDTWDEGPDDDENENGEIAE